MHTFSFSMLLIVFLFRFFILKQILGDKNVGNFLKTQAVGLIKNKSFNLFQSKHLGGKEHSKYYYKCNYNHTICDYHKTKQNKINNL